MATERSAQATWQGDLMSGSGEIHEAPSGAFGPLQVTLGGARGGAARRQDEPRGADRRGARGLLRDGALERAREGRACARAARDVGDA